MLNEKDTAILLKELDAVKTGEELREYLSKNITNGSYADWLYQKKEEFDKLQKEHNNAAKKTNSGLIYKGESFSLWNLAGLSKSYFYSIMAGTKTPSRINVIRIGLALKVTVEEMNKSLKLAGWKELYVKKAEDAIIIYGIKTRKTVDEINEQLSEVNADFCL